MESYFGEDEVQIGYLEQAIIFKGGVWSLGGWHDIWCWNHSLKELYPGFYTCAVDKNPAIHLVMDSQLDKESGTRT